MREVLCALAACLMAIALIYVVHGLVEIGATGSDREIIVALEIAAVVVLIATVLGEEVLHFFSSIFRLIKGKRLEQRSRVAPVATVFVTIISSLAIYFAFMRYVVPA